MIFTDLIANARRYGPKSSTHDLLKALAITIMIVDHVGYFFFPQELWWRAVGRTGFPIWFFMAGYAKPSRPSSTLLLLSALMIGTDAALGMPLFPTNALLGIYLCRLFVSSRLVNQPLTIINWLFALVAVIATLPATYLLFEYGFQGVLYALAGFYCRSRPGHPLTILTLLFACFVFIAMQSITFAFGPWQLSLMVGGTILTTAMLAKFRLAYPAMPRWSAGPINFLARNSHYVYAVHFIAFEIITHFYVDPTRSL